MSAPVTHTHDVAIIGGSFAGLSAALYLARARRTVAIFDHGRTRNRFSPHGHGFLGMDGVAPDEMRRRGRRDVTAYPTVDLRQTEVETVARQDDGFAVAARDGETVTARRLILACGMRDALPDIGGLAECWGKTVVHCPYCHGYELADRPTGVLMTGEGALHQVRMLRDWTDTLTLFANDHDLPDTERRDLAAAGITIVDGSVATLHHQGGALGAVNLRDGTRVPVSALYVQPRGVPACPFAETLGCMIEDQMMGKLVTVDETLQTSVEGVYAAGDLMRPMFNALFAASDGAMAGVACHRSLMG